MTAHQSREPVENLTPAYQGQELAAPRPAPPHRWGFGAFLLVEAVLLASAAFVSALLRRAPREGSIPMRDVLIGTMAPTVTAALVAVLITVVRGNGPLADLRLSWRWDDVRMGLRFGLLGLVCTTIGAFVWTRVVGEENASSAIGALVEDQPMAVSAAVAMFLYLWLLGPICEEVIYRGLLWGAVERMHWGKEKWGRLAAFLLSTAVFAVSHLEPLRTSLLLVIAIPIGLARLVTGRLLGSIVAHQMNNFLPALAILLTALGVVHL
ncbi:hypothetical protein SAMN05421810_101153 [Amycolatopsis arida]|uniref:CAAX prenyl protease 2/Lysostaphin resistance protein A-like domain-containing protein n=1 Tax=Amycolatopsis arida TaxID=587909 RepID=A0A1I5KHP8_9PSEU|nr:CPBP family intramembrane glutamic endopeptidase [Amycolatopsis arida]TDX97049.1 hypothetical protein CLV69_102151 [Amycolatopsis arida]SFO84467.1 hypothetical protein SAMN05421810_101153 [Amycolatopsis arida]